MPTTSHGGDRPAAARRRSVGIPDGRHDDDDGDDTTAGRRRRGAAPPKARRGGGGRRQRKAVTAAAAAACCAAASSAAAAAADGGRAVAPRGAFGVPRRLPPRDVDKGPAASEVLLELPRGGSVDAAGSASGDDGSASSTSRRRGRRGDRGGGGNKAQNNADGDGRDAEGRDRGKHQKQKQRRQRGPFGSRSRSRDGSGGGKGTGSSPPAPSPPPPTPPQPQQQLPEDYYELLGVSKTSTPDEIQKAYRRMAVRTHPDKTPHGDRTHFDAISEAYDVLSDESKKSIYDRYGKRGVEANAAGGSPGGGGVFAEDMFRSFFGGAPGGAGFGFSTAGSGGFFQRSQQSQSQSQSAPRRQRTRSVRYQLEVSLEDLYRGAARSVVIAKPEADDAPRRRRVDIDVERGARHGSTVVLSGELDHVPHATPGDIIFVLAQAPHELFTRRNADLMCEVEVSPREALTGIGGGVTHLDDRELELVTDPDGPPVHDGEVRVLRGEGMPVRGRPGRFGDLYVKFKVKWPVTGYAGLTTEERAILGDLMDVAAAAAASSSSSNSSASKAGEGGGEDADADADVEGIRERLRERLAELLRRGGVGDEAAAAVAASAAEASAAGVAPNATAAAAAAAAAGNANTTASPEADGDAGEVDAGGKEKGAEEEGGKGGGKRRGRGRDRQQRQRAPRYLQPALASDFGTSHPDEEGNLGSRDNHHHHPEEEDDDEDHFGFQYGRPGGAGFGGGNPFQQHFGFFSSPGAGAGPGGDRGGRYYDDAGDAHRESNVQCQQM